MPANTGNIARTCAGTDTVLDLIKPLGFKIDDKHLKRAGLDYWDQVQVHVHENLPSFYQTIADPEHELFLVSKFGTTVYSNRDYTNSDHEYYFLFGKETTGLPAGFEQQHADQTIRIPQNDDHIRALNVSNTCAIVIYEVLRQQQFGSLDQVHHYEHDKLAAYKAKMG
ncbi:tRNA rRNA methyltransferase SpoU [Fructilactobacillus florum DSM 22689 = JCM 16035]|nr:tRNA rRNA methyltransferase SpoU [Fructilactobacillus florum DSM 22689 = JCM 16035]